jgi:hypothetical protein
MRRKARRDTNEPDIIQAIKDMGASVVQLNDPGIPDLLIGLNGVNVLAEVKTDIGKLTHEQTYFMGNWTGQAAVVRTAQDVIELLTRITTQRVYEMPPTITATGVQCRPIIV